MRPLSERLLNNIRHPLRLYKWWEYQKSRSIDRDTFLISMTGAGTHWVCIMFSKALIEAYKLSDEISSIRYQDLVPSYLNKRHRFKYNNLAHIPRIQHSHSPYSLIFRGTRVILLMRDLRNAIVTHYRTHTAVKGVNLSFSDFLRGRCLDARRQHTLRSRVNFLNSWARNVHKLSSLYVIRYEDLRTDTAAEMCKLIDFAGFPVLNQELIERVVEFGSIENMRKIEKENPLPQYKNKVNKVGWGRSDSYKDYFSGDDRRYLSEIVFSDLINSYGYDYNNW